MRSCSSSTRRGFEVFLKTLKLDSDNLVAVEDRTASDDTSRDEFVAEDDGSAVGLECDFDELTCSNCGRCLN